MHFFTLNKFFSSFSRWTSVFTMFIKSKKSMHFFTLNIIQWIRRQNKIRAARDVSTGRGFPFSGWPRWWWWGGEWWLWLWCWWLWWLWWWWWWWLWWLWCWYNDDDDNDHEDNGDDGDLHLQRSFSRDPRTSSKGRKLDNDDARCCDRRLRHRRDPALCDRPAPHHLLEVIFWNIDIVILILLHIILWYFEIFFSNRFIGANQYFSIVEFLDYPLANKITLFINVFISFSYPINFAIYCGMSR